MTGQKHLLIDCDPGVDDCLAIMMALSPSNEGDVKVVGITCVNGNVDVRQVCMNAARIVKLCKMTDQVPIFRGCEHPIITMPNKVNSTFYHGKDGLGNAPDAEPCRDETLLDIVQKEHAVNAILRLSRKYAGKLQVIALGPLTNVALATRIDPELPSRIKSLHVLGGTIRGWGNVTPGSEYNFYTDPEAADIVFGSFSARCPTQLVTYEVTIDHGLPVDWFDNLLDGDDERRRFFKEVYKDIAHMELEDVARGDSNGYVVCDAYMMAVALDPSCVTKSSKAKICIELAGRISRGNLVIDHRGKGSPFLYEGNIELIEGIDIEKFKRQVARSFPG